MLRGRLAEVLAVSGAAAILTLALAAPVLRAPSERMFGMEIVGRHHDPFTVMAQLDRPISLGVYSQPVTDISGALFARLFGAVAAYNALVLFTFPLSAAAAYLLARYLSLSRLGAMAVAMAYAFSPFHLAHAAYHPHIAQTQWLPLYLLALWRCLDTASPAAVAVLGAATAAVTLSNFYGGLIAAVITPVALAAKRGVPARTRVLTIGCLVLIAAGGFAYVSYTAGAVVANPAAFAFPRADLFRYSAKWWSYLIPPVEHPLLGAGVRRMWDGAGVREGLLEQQVSLGWGVIALGLIAVFCWLRPSNNGDMAAGAHVPLFLIIAVTALICSLSPERTIGGLTFVRPSALLYTIAPMFRAYARFGVVVQLMAALLAGVGIDYLRRTGTRSAQIVCVVLVAFAAGEYAVAPSAQWRDVLPTSAHRWLMQQPGGVRALDCTPLTQESWSVQWLTHHHVSLLDGEINDCAEPSLSSKLAAKGYTHLLVRRDTPDGEWYSAHPAPNGLRVAAHFNDGEVLAVTARPPDVYTATMTGFFPREHDSAWSWRWMGSDATWTIVNTNARAVAASVGIELSAFHHVRQMDLLVDTRLVTRLTIEPARRIYQIDPFTISPGYHQLLFQPVEPPAVAADVIDNGDPRALSFAVGTWRWGVQGDRR